MTWRMLWQMTSVDDVRMTWQMTSPRADVSRRTLARAGACRRVTECGEYWRPVTARGLYWRRVKARASDAENSGSAWRRVEGPMKMKFHRKADRRDYFPMV